MSMAPNVTELAGLDWREGRRGGWSKLFHIVHIQLSCLGRRISVT